MKQHLLKLYLANLSVMIWYTAFDLQSLIEAASLCKTNERRISDTRCREIDDTGAIVADVGQRDSETASSMRRLVEKSHGLLS